MKANEAIILASNIYKNDLSIIALGPLTNLATAYLLDNTLPSRVNSVSIMGGAYSAIGRHEHFCSDFNFHLDPEAASIVLQNYSKIILTTIQSTEGFKLDKTEEIFQNRTTEKGNFIAQLY